VRRADVAQALDLPGAEYAGFSFDLDLRHLSYLLPAKSEREEIVTLSLGAIGPDGYETVALPGYETVVLLKRSVRLQIPALPPPPRWGTPLVGHLDYPVNGTTVWPGKVMVRGWAVVNERPASMALVHVDGKPATFGPIEEDRPEVADYLGDPELALSGFSFFFDTEEPGGEPREKLEVVVSAMGETLPGRAPSEPIVHELARLTIAVDRSPVDIEGWIDSPNGEVALDRAPLIVRGWALAAEGPIAEVEIRVNGRSHGLARLGMPTPALPQVRKAELAPIAGFEHLVDLSTLPARALTVMIEALVTDLTGAFRCTASRSCRLINAGGPATTPATADPEEAAQRRREGQARIAESRASTLTFVSEPGLSPTDGLNLLAVTHELGLGGGQLWLFELLERCGAGREFPCTVIAQKGGALHRDLNDLGINVHVTSSFPVDDADSYEGRIRELAMLARKLGANAVLANTMSSFSGADVAARLGLGCVWAIHESISPSMYWSIAYPPGGVDPLVRSRVEELLAWTPAVVFEAEATRQLYLGTVPTEHALVVPYGINTAMIDHYFATVPRERARAGRGLAPDQRVLLVMGTTEPRKSQIVIAEAFAQIAPRHPEAVLVFVGDNGTAYAQSLRGFIETCGVAAQIRLEPVTSDTYSWYRAADVLVSSSDVESLPRSFLEAMCFGLPVVAASVFGIPELIQDGRTGYLFRPRDLRATAEALQRVLSADTDELASVAAAARAQVRERYDSAGYAQSLLRLLNQSALNQSAIDPSGRIAL
jgi:glycosyltransferase involved in cell wall biosynthesis